MAWIKPSRGARIEFADNEYERLTMQGLLPGASVYQIDEGILFIWDGMTWYIAGGKEDESSHTHTNKSILDKITSSGSGQIITIAERTKLNEIEQGANKYIHPGTHPATIIDQDSTHRFVTDTEKSTWSSKQDSLGYIPEDIVNKGKSGGYAPLNNEGKLTSSFLENTVEISEGIVSLDNEVANLGSITNKFNRVFANEIYLSDTALHINGSLALSGSSGSVILKGVDNQSTIVQSSGSGITRIASGNIVQIESSGVSSRVNIQGTGSGSRVSVDSDDSIFITSPEISLNGVVNISDSLSTNDLVVSGNVSVLGEQFLVDAEIVQVRDNIIEINKGEVGSGITAGKAGLKVDRGTAPDYLMIFDESTQTFNVGMEDDLEILATRNYVQDNKYTHPSTHSASMITETSTLKIMTATERTKLSGIEEGANKYTHPSSHPASIITESSSKRFVSDAEKTTWSNKWDFNESEIRAIKVDSALDADTVSGFTVGINVPTGAKFTDTVYTHPANHPASIITETSSKRFVSDSQISTWNAKSDLALGTSSTDAYRGDRGKIAYDHSQSNHAPVNAWVYNEATIKAVKVSKASDADTVSGKTVGINVPANAKFTDTIYTHPSSHPVSMITGLAPVATSGEFSDLVGIPEASTSTKGIVQLSSSTGSTSTSLAATASAVKSAYDLAAGKWTYNEATIKGVKVNNAANADTVGGLTVLTAVPAGAKFTDTVYTHPSSHPPSIIAQDSSNRFVTDAQISTWNAKGSSNLALGESSSTAYRGDRGKIAYDHSQSAHAPSNAWVYNEATIKGVKVNSAGTADTLATARTINGTSFNGSANITTARWGTARTLTIGSTGKSVNGSANVAWTLAEIGAAPASHNHSASNITSGTLGVARGGTGRATLTSGKVLVGNGTSAVLMPTNLHWNNSSSRLGIGTTAPNQALHVVGMTESSQGFKTGSFEIVYDSTSKCLNFNFVG